MNTELVAGDIRRPISGPSGLWRASVVGVRRVTPRMARVTVAGAALTRFGWDRGDQSVMIYLYPDDADLPADLTAESARAMFATLRPEMRTYTVRRFDPATTEIDFDFVLHDEHGPASRWASRVDPGQELIFVGPSPAHGLDPALDAHLMIGDETALPAIGVLLAELPATARTQVFVEVADVHECQELDAPAGTTLTWLCRDGRSPGDNGLLVDALREATLPRGRVGVWAAGEKAAMGQVRAHLVRERGFDRRAVRPRTYWRA